MNATERERLEIDFWRNDPLESPESESIIPIIDKVKDAEVLRSIFQTHRNLFPDTGRILELGAGQGWASCFLKRLLPQAHVVTTDISPYALESLPKWARIWGAVPNESYACNSFATREASGSIDLVFCFAAAHHFSDHAQTLAEIARILTPDGAALYCYEPTSSAMLYRAALWRVNRKRPVVHEDLLVPGRLREQAQSAGLEVQFAYFPSTLKRGRIESIYYSALSMLPPLQRILPCTANVVIHRETGSGLVQRDLQIADYRTKVDG